MPTLETRPVKVEFVTYKIEEMQNTISHLVRNFTIYSGISGTNMWWLAFPLQSKHRIENLLPEPYCLTSTEDVSLFFKGPSLPIPIIKDDSVVYKPREPRVIIAEDIEHLNPGRRWQVEKMDRRIAEEMHSGYGMDVEENPLRLIFPKRNYAKEITVLDANSSTSLKDIGLQI